MVSSNLVLRSMGPAIEHLKPHLSLQVFTPGQVLKHDGMQTERVYFPTSGLISSRVVLESGHELECALIGWTSAAGLLGALGLPDGWARYVGLTEGDAWSMPSAHLAAVARKEPAIERVLTRFSFAQIGYAAHLGVCNAMHTTDQRLARWLLTAARLLNASDVAVSQNQLAHILGLQRSVVNPALQRLKAGGLVDIGRGRVCIIDPDRLNRRACECLAPLSRALSCPHDPLVTEPGTAPV